MTHADAVRLPDPPQLTCEPVYVLKLRVHSRWSEQRRRALSHILSTPVCLTFVSIFLWHSLRRVRVALG
jgi:hypothetical protein